MGAVSCTDLGPCAHILGGAGMRQQRLWVLFLFLGAKEINTSNTLCYPALLTKLLLQSNMLNLPVTTSTVVMKLGLLGSGALQGVRDLY